MAKAGASGTIKCPHCRHQVPEGCRYCLFCGASLGGAATATASKAGTKRRRSRHRVSAKAPTPTTPRKPTAAKAGNNSTVIEFPVRMEE